MEDSLESSLTQVCVLCFEKTETFEKEDGEVVLCEKCKKEMAEGNFGTGTDGIVIARVEETILDKHIDFEESEHNIQTKSEDSDNKETRMLNQKWHLPSSSHNVKDDLEINIKTEIVDSYCKLEVKDEPEELGHLVFTTSDLGMVKDEPVDQEDPNHDQYDQDKSTKIQSTEVSEKDPLDTSEPSCHICQAEATGKQFYGGVCCFSCRAFFRRAGIIDKNKPHNLGTPWAGGSVFLCSTGEDNCLINKVTRTRCKKCRYQRCLEIGMKLELIDRTIPKQKNNQENQSKQAVQRIKPKSTYTVTEKEESLLKVKIENEVSAELNNDIGHLEEQSDHFIFQVTETCEQFLEVKLETELSEPLNNHAGHTEEENIQECEEMDIFVGHNVDKDGFENIQTNPDMLLKRPKKRIRKRYPVIPKNCPICLKEVKYLNDHIKDVHSEKPPENLICNDCGKVFSKRKKLRGHIAAVHRVQPTKCDICSQEFKNLHSLRGHKAKVHESISKVTCPTCSKEFETKLKLYYHERAVHTLEVSKCEACGKTYKNKFLLQKHVKVNHKDLYEAQKNVQGIQIC